MWTRWTLNGARCRGVSIGRRLTTSCGRPAFNRELLLYSERLDDTVDSSVKRSSAKLARQEQLGMREANDKLRAALLKPEESNLSVAVPFVYGGAFSVRGGHAHVQPDEVIEGRVVEQDKEAEDSSKRVYPFGLFQPASIDGGIPRLGEGPPIDPEEPPKRRRGRRGRGAKAKLARDDTEKENDFDVLDDELRPQEVRKLLSDDDLFRYGTSDQRAPASNVPCGGCGAILHCRDPKLPGFTPAELFKGKNEQQLRSVICQRCYVMREYNVALKVSVSPQDYPKTIQHLHTKRAIILLGDLCPTTTGSTTSYFSYLSLTNTLIFSHRPTGLPRFRVAKRGGSSGYQQTHHTRWKQGRPVTQRLDRLPAQGGGLDEVGLSGEM
jgi:hypothetical protein